jgi:hypothetical protein
MQKPTSIRSIRQGGMGGGPAGRQGWPPGKGGSKRVGLGEPGRGSWAGPVECGRLGGRKTRRRRGAGEKRGGNYYRYIDLYLYIFILLYVYMNIFVYDYIGNYYLPGMSMEQTPSDLFNPFGAALRTIFRHP